MKKRCGSMLLCLLLGACGGATGYNPARDVLGFERDDRPLATTFVYDCNGYEFVARLGPGEMALWLEDRYVVLSQVRSASGALYEEGDTSFWIKGEEAMLTIGQQSYLNCQLMPARVPWEDARRRGVDFRAQGNEPGWSLEIKRGRQLLFVADYGALRVLVPDPGEVLSGDMRVYAGGTAASALRVEIEEVPCADTMSGDTFPASVVVTLDNTAYSGCGESLDYPWYDLE